MSPTVASAPLTRGARVNADISALLRAKHTLLWIVTREETRVERALIEAAGAVKYGVRFWDCVDGVTTVTGAKEDAESPDPAAAMRFLETREDRSILVMRDLHKWMDSMILRQLCNLSRSLQSAPSSMARTVVILTPSAEIPPELAGRVTLIDYPLPDRAEVAAILDEVIGSLPEERRLVAVPPATRDAAIDAAVGLTAEEAANCYAKSLVVARGKVDASLVAGEKKRVIDASKVLTWHEPDARGLDAIGGLDLLKAWLRVRRSAFSPRARAFGLPAPKGVMLVGVPGGGKSLTAKCIATAWNVPLLRLDLGALRSKYVGESEGNVRKALAVAEAVGTCVLWLDEIEKAMGGATGPQGDGGVAADALGAVLSWMQERAGSVFVVATANDVRSLPPEFLRKGRFDDIFWIDLPTTAERESIVATAIRFHRRDPGTVDCKAVARATASFTGAEIAAIVPEALLVAFDEGERTLVTSDLIAAAANVVPLAKTASGRIEELRAWAQGKARPASFPEVAEKTSGRGSLDLDD